MADSSSRDPIIADDPAFTDRVTVVRDQPVRRGDYVLYWMQQSQRVCYNHALEYATRAANAVSLPLLVCFGLTSSYPEASARAYRFMLEGLAVVADELAARGTRFVVRHVGAPYDVAASLAERAAVVVCDRGYLAHQRSWRRELAERIGSRLIEVESDLIVPVAAASDKREYAARTIRPKLHRALARYLVPMERTPLARDSLDLSYLGRADDLDPTTPTALEASLSAQSGPGPVSWFARGGTGEAMRRLDHLRGDRLLAYETQRNDPGGDVASGLSPYLHFGQISALQIALELEGRQYAADLASGSARMRPQPGSVGMRTGGEPWVSARDAFLEELIVRRELAHNYVWFEPGYPDYDALPEWSRRTLATHASDERPVCYDEATLERAQTHDPYWNAAMTEMRVTGSMHNYMRMYWGKKVLEWSRTPQEAFDLLLTLNNRYFLDGRDPNSYANVGWVFGLHDRPWAERSVYGTVRTMTAAGLDRKFTMSSYLQKVESLLDRALAEDAGGGLQGE